MEILNIDNDLIKDAIHIKRPLILFAPKFSGKSKVYSLIRSDLESQTEGEINEIEVSFTAKGARIALQKAFETENTYAKLIDYFLNSALVSSSVASTIIYLNRIENLSDSEIRWLISNYYDLKNVNSYLIDLNIILILEGTLSIDQVEKDKNSPFRVDFNISSRVSYNGYEKYVKSKFENDKLDFNIINDLWRITSGDQSVTDKLVNILLSDQFVGMNQVLDAMKKYAILGSFNDSMKWYFLDSILSINDLNYVNNLYVVKQNIEDNWLEQSNEFKKLAFIGGLVTIDNNFKCFDLYNMVYNCALNRSQKLDTLLTAEVNENIIDKDFSSSYLNEISKLRKQLYLGLAENVLVGKAKMVGVDKVEIIGTFNFDTYLETVWTTKNTIKEANQAYILQYDINDKPNSNTKIIKYFPIT